MLLLIGREQLVDGQQPIMIGLGWLVAPGLIERALAHGASWSLAGRPPSMTRKLLEISRDGLITFFIASGAAESPPIGSRPGVIHPGTDEDRPNGNNKDTMEMLVEPVMLSKRTQQSGHDSWLYTKLGWSTNVCTRCFNFIKEISNSTRKYD
jgi:hypothetical protein